MVPLSMVVQTRRHLELDVWVGYEMKSGLRKCTMHIYICGVHIRALY